MKSLHLFSTSVLLLIGFTAGAQQQLSLQQSKDSAVKNNVAVLNSTLSITNSEEGKKAANTAYYPSVSGTAVGMYAFKDIVPAIPVYLPNGINNFYFAGVTAMQPIYQGGKIVASNKLASLQLEVSKTRNKQSRDSVELITEQKYWQIIDIQEQYKALQSGQRYLDTLLKEMQDNLKAGLIARNDLLRVKVQRSQIIVNMHKAHNGRLVALADFCQYIGIGYDSLLVLTDSVAHTEDPATLYRAPETVLQTNDDYHLLQNNIEAEKLQTQIKRSDYLPKVSAGISAAESGVIGKGVGSTFMPIALGTVSIPISGWWGEAKHSLQQRKIQEQIAMNNLANGKNQIQVGVLKSWFDLQNAYEQIGLADENVAQATENLKVSKDNYQAGLNNLSDLLDAQSLWQQTISQLAQAKTDYQVKLSSYRYIAGMKK